ncbi:N-acetylgalactosaminyltransferase 7-like [Glandiceps talaboti]
MIYFWKKTRVLAFLTACLLLVICLKLFAILPTDQDTDDDPQLKGQEELKRGNTHDIQNAGDKNNNLNNGELKIADKKRIIGLVQVDGYEVDLEKRRRELRKNQDKKVQENAGDQKLKETSLSDPEVGETIDKLSERAKFGDKFNSSNVPSAVYKKGIIGNYEPILEPRTGFGENGISVKLNPADEAKYSKSMREFGFNMVISDQISLDRAVKDIRDPDCKYMHYPEKLPTASVVVVFSNEGWSTLMRTIHSIVNTSPPHLLAEIVMVDDLSNKDHLKSRLEEYIKDPKFQGKIKLVRNQKREGLIRARTIGAVNAEKGEVVIFLDAHCECSPNWLPPLLAPIARNRTAVVCPLVDSIDAETFGYAPQGDGMARGVFNWDFFYKRIPVNSREMKRRKLESEPYRSPVMAGGLFGMSRSFFLDIGGYDPGLEIWGGEQYEISFKIWMCGGTLEFVPCSRVGHIYRRGGVPYTYPKPASLGNERISLVDRNYLRVAEVWMDDHKEYLYRMKPDLRGKHYGDISDQVKFRQQHCPHSFQWFMDEVAYDIPERFPLPAENVAWGRVEAVGKNFCLDSMGKTGGAKAGMHQCHSYGGSQLFRLNKDGQLRVNEECLYADNSAVKIQRCIPRHDYGWKYDQSSMQISVADNCLDFDGSMVSMYKCTPEKSSQKWTITPTS